MTTSAPPSTRETALLLVQKRGRRYQATADAPTTAIICEAGPVRVCHSRRMVAAKAGTAAPITRRIASRSWRRIHIVRPQPIIPVIGSATTSVAMRQPCR